MVFVSKIEKTGGKMKFLQFAWVVIVGHMPISLIAEDPPRILFHETLPSKQSILQIYFSEKDGVFSDRENRLIAHVRKCVNDSFYEISSINKVIENDIEGMSSSKVRHLLNNLCTLPHARYLEIGTWKGSTFIAALANNQTTVEYAVGMDDWSEFGGPKADFERNLNQFLPSNSYRYEIYSQDCFAIQPSSIIKAPINLYLYDGNHSAVSQEMAFTHYDEVLDDVFIALVDDWSEESVRQGTFNAFAKLNYEVLFEVCLPGPYTLWWNGFYVAVVRKSQKID